jgi:signal transduction histidine kinase
MMIAVTGLILHADYSSKYHADNTLLAAAKRAAAESSEHATYSDLLAEEREDLIGTDLAISVVASNGHFLAKTQKDAPGLSSEDRKNWRVVSLPLKDGNFIVVGMPWSKAQKEHENHGMELIFLAVFVVMIASVGAWFLVGRALSPIPQLARQANTSSADNLAVTLAPPSQDAEMIELVDTLNDLLRRLTDSAATKGRFYSAASHELRTPLQALSGHLELALRHDRSNEEYRATIEEAYVQTKRLISLSRALLLLYQLDSSTALPPNEPVDLVEICKRSIAHCSQLIVERSLRIDLRSPEETRAFAPPNHIEILMRNLIENAAKYSSEHGRVVVEIEKGSKEIRLKITNDCVLPPEWDSTRIFEPFSRPDLSRNSKTGGVGLGLTICKAIADTNGWSLKIDSEKRMVNAELTILVSGDN